MAKSEPERHARQSLLIAIILLGGIVLTVLVILPHILIGPGLPPNMDFAATMLSQPGFNSCYGNSSIRDIDSAFCVEQQRLEPYPLFPSLTQTSAYGLFRNTSSGSRYIVAIWYFNNRDDFLAAQDRLQAYIGKHGTALPVTLDLSGEQEKVRLFNQENPRRELKLVPASLQATAYTGNATAGYFFVSNQQFAAGRDDHLIEYFGMTDNTSLQDGSEDVKQLIAFSDDTWNLFHGSAALS